MRDEFFLYLIFSLSVSCVGCRMPCTREGLVECPTYLRFGNTVVAPKPPICMLSVEVLPNNIIVITEALERKCSLIFYLNDTQRYKYFAWTLKKRKLTIIE